MCVDKALNYKTCTDSFKTVPSAQTRGNKCQVTQNIQGEYGVCVCGGERGRIKLNAMHAYKRRGRGVVLTVHVLYYV